MPKVTYVEPGGRERVVDVSEGWTLMQGATANGVEGIEAECGGSCSCATCHVYVDEQGLAKLPPPGDTEQAMLEFVAADRKPNSRLSCQIQATHECEGLIVRMPQSQG